MVGRSSSTPISRRAALIAGGGLAGAALGIQTSAAATTQPRPGAIVDRRLTRLFGRYADRAGRWTGADSAYSLRLPDGRIAWLYSDTFLGTVNPDGSRPLTSPFLHNSIIVQHRNTLVTVTGGTHDHPASLVAPAGAEENQRWYWFGDGTVEGNRLRVLLLEFTKTGDGPFDFAYQRTAIASFRLPHLTLTGVTALPDPVPAAPVQWASAIHETDHFCYVYGVEDRQATKYAHLARVPRGRLTSTHWQFFTGSGWSADPTQSARILSGVANEFSVSRYAGRYLLVTSDARTQLSPDIVAYSSSSLTGGFGDPVKLYTTPETGGNVYSYNAKAHPELSDRGRLLVTYNVNSFVSDELYADARIYRPRYLDVSLPRR